MPQTQQHLRNWVASGDLSAEQLQQALALTHTTPPAGATLRFLSCVVLALAVAMLCSGVIFFFAYNWDALTRWHKFALAQGALLLALAPLIRFDLPHAVAQASLFAASLLVGALLALVGQTYQSGADTYQLFALWAALILPWVMIARMPALWLLLLVLLNLCVALLLSDFLLQPWMLWLDNPTMLLFLLNASAAALWLYVTRHTAASRTLNWAQRSINLYSLMLITLMAMGQIMRGLDSDLLTLITWVLFVSAWWYLYRVRHLDLVMLSALIMACIVLSVGLIAQIPEHYLGLEGLFLLMAVSVMGLSSAGSMWLKRLKHTSQKNAADTQGAKHE